MKKVKKLLVLIAVLSAVGISYAAYTLKSMPEVFDWEDEDE